MPCRTTIRALLLALAATAAATPFACRIEARDSYLLAERFEMVVLPDARRTKYRLVVQNPHPHPAAVLAGITLHGLVESPAGPVTVAAGGRRC
jgi:hypothetical protein